MSEPLLDGRYRLLEKIGEGGEARVFRALDTETGQDVAVRLGRQPARLLDLPVPESFAPGWVRLLRCGVDPLAGGYQVVELLQGRTLDAWVEKEPLAYPAWLEFMRQSFAAVNAVHQTGQAHGDLHPENFIFDDPTSTWKLLELPFLRFQPPEERSALFGSIYTLAPEQLDGESPSRATDLYALGCVYYYAASGRYPHEGATEAEVAIARLRSAPEPLGCVVPSLPVNAVNGVMQLLSREPGERRMTIPVPE